MSCCFTPIPRTSSEVDCESNPARLLGGDDHVVAPHAPPVIAVPGDVEEGGQGGAGEPDHGAVQQTAQGGANCGQDLK